MQSIIHLHNKHEHDPFFFSSGMSIIFCKMNLFNQHIQHLSKSKTASKDDVAAIRQVLSSVLIVTFCVTAEQRVKAPITA